MTTLSIPERKIILMGDVGVGKSSLVERLKFNRFSDTYAATIGVVIKSHTVQNAGPGNDRALTLAIWDTDGNFRDNIFQRTYMSGAAAGIVVSDAARPQSIALMAELIELFRERLSGRPVHAVITKVDLVQNVADIAVPPTLTSIGVPVHPTSSKTGHNVSPMFQDIATTILRRGA